MNQEHAFPNPHRTDLTGMTLRQYFAAKAMQGLLADGWSGYYIAMVQEAYRIADIMLKEGP